MKNYTRREALNLMLTGSAGAVLSQCSHMSFITNPDETQTFSHGIPNEAYQQLQRLEHHGIAVFAFTPEGGWVIVTKNGHHFARNIPQSCYQQLLYYLNNSHSIRCIAFPPSGGNSWLIVTDRSKYARNIPKECNQKLEEYAREGREITSVAFPPRGGNSWVIVANSAFYARNIPDECYQIMRNLRQHPRPDGPRPRIIQEVIFAPDGGWLVLAGDYFFARNIPNECFTRMKAFRRQHRQVDLVTFPPQGGNRWSIISNTTFRHPPTDEIRRFETNLPNGESIWQRMRRSNVPGVSVAAVIDNQITWACGYGHLMQDEEYAAHPESLFQAASISKAVAAIGAMRLVRDGAIDLSDDIRDYLSWPVPIASGVNLTNKPTLEGLLSHQAGFNVHGFAGYAADNRVPTLEEILRGSSNRRDVTVNSPAINIIYNSGTQWAYSGGGYEVLEKLIEDLTSQDFRTWMRVNILRPMGMNDSTFALSPAQKYFEDHNVATGHDSNGTPITGARRQYPEAAAAGLYTNCLDLARVIVMLNSGGIINGTRILNQNQVDEMLTDRVQGRRRYGLGLELNSQNPDQSSFRYEKGGTNYGFRSLFYGYPNRRAGVVVMTNGDATDGGQFRRDVANAVAGTYGW